MFKLDLKRLERASGKVLSRSDVSSIADLVENVSSVSNELSNCSIRTASSAPPIGRDLVF